MTLVTRGLGGITGGSVVQTIVNHPIAGIINQPELIGVAAQPRLNGKIDLTKIVPSYYPPLSGATDVWHWGKALGDYQSEILGDVYIAGKQGSSGNVYGVAGPANTDMKGVYWNNTAGLFSHHTAPGTDGSSGNSSGAINAAMLPGTSDFQLFFGMKSVSPQLDTFYSFFDYDIRDNPTPFKAGIELFVSTAGAFAPVSLVALIFDDALQFHEAKAVLPAGTLFNDGLWHHVKLKFDRSLLVPTCVIDTVPYTMTKVFGVDLKDLVAINPVNGLRFGMREYTEAPSGRANLQMCGAAYAKNLTYDWPYWG